jgi:Family of unknown function (DUF5752)
MPGDSVAQPFFVKDCALAVISTGEAAASIVEFKDVLTRIPASSLYFHFWGRHFRPSFVHPELHNDFARWTSHYLHDPILAERLGIVDPTEYADLEELRQAVLEVIEQRLEEIERISWSTRENKFHFLRSVIVVFDTSTTIAHPFELKTLLPTLTATSIFYHFIDARRRTPTSIDDFSSWLAEEGGEYADLLKKIQHIDPYFLSLTEQRQKLTEIMGSYFS